MVSNMNKKICHVHAQPKSMSMFMPMSISMWQKTLFQRFGCKISDIVKNLDSNPT
jgi:hypothetical protein